MSAERISDGFGRTGRSLPAAAIAAEMETGRRETTTQAARTSLLIRMARITAGSMISLLGLMLIPMPGPGLVVLAGGLSILAVDVPFARRLLDKVRARIPQDADGTTPRWVFALMGGATALGLASSAALLLS